MDFWTSGYKRDLRAVLFKLGIKSAKLHFYEEMMLRMMCAFGKPDELYLDPATLQAYEDIVKSSK